MSTNKPPFSIDEIRSAPDFVSLQNIKTSIRQWLDRLGSILNQCHSFEYEPPKELISDYSLGLDLWNLCNDRQRLIKENFKQVYYDTLSEFVRCRQYIGSGKYETPTSSAMKLSEKLASMYDNHPSWCDEVDDEFGDNLRMNG